MKERHGLVTMKGMTFENPLSYLEDAATIRLRRQRDHVT
jgi:hypothetical protein